MEKQFKFLLILFVVYAKVFGQEMVFYENDHQMVNGTKVFVDASNTDLLLKSSEDDKIHISYKLFFNRYTKRQREKHLKNISIESKKDGPNIFVEVESNQQSNLSRFLLLFYRIRPNENNAMSNLKGNKKKDVLELIKSVNVSNDYLGEVFENGDGPKQNRYKNVKHILEIRVPKNLSIDIRGENAICGFKEVDNDVVLNIKNGGVLAEQLNNPENKFFVKDGIFLVERLQLGEYHLKDIHTGRMATVSESNIFSDFSNIEIGEVGPNNSITDFNSKLWFYSFSKEFKQLKLEGNYSKFNFYQGEIAKYLKEGVQSDSFDGTIGVEGREVLLKMQNSLLYHHDD